MAASASAPLPENDEISAEVKHFIEKHCPLSQP